MTCVRKLVFSTGRLACLCFVRSTQTCTLVVVLPALVLCADYFSSCRMVDAAVTKWAESSLPADDAKGFLSMCVKEQIKVSQAPPPVLTRPSVLTRSLMAVDERRMCIAQRRLVHVLTWPAQPNLGGHHRPQSKPIPTSGCADASSTERRSAVPSAGGGHAPMRGVYSRVSGFETNICVLVHREMPQSPHFLK
jgi:hypothetical protein